MRILLFAGVRDAAGCDYIEVDVQDPATASDVIESAATAVPDAAELIRISRLAVDGRYVDGAYRLNPSDLELALIPPVSGG